MKFVCISFSSRVGLTVVLLWAAVACCAQAAVYQCKSVGGGVDFTDQPCTDGVKGIEINVKPASGNAPSATVGKDRSAEARAALHERMEAALTPACRTLQLRMGEALKETSQTTEAERAALLGRYTKECLPLAQAAQEEEWARQKRQAESDRQRSACEAKRKVVAEGRARWDRLSEGERNGVISVEKELANGCH